MEFAKWIAVKHFFSSQGLRAVGDWTRQSLGIFSNFKQLRCSWGGKKSPPTQRVAFMEISSSSSEIQKHFSFGTWGVVPLWWHSAPYGTMWVNRCTLNRRQSAHELCHGLGAISLSPTCRGRERRHCSRVHSRAFCKMTHLLEGWISGYWNTNPRCLVPHKRYMISTS